MRLIYKIIKKRTEILAIAAEHGVANVRVFGSVSRGQEKAHSDIDLLVDVVKRPDGSEGNYINFGLGIRKLFKRRTVEVCTPETLHPRFKDKVLKNCVSIMEDDLVIDMTEKDDRDYIVNVMKAMEKSEVFWKMVKLGKNKWLAETEEGEMIRNAVRSVVQIPVEEMVRTISKSLKKKVPEVDWEDLKNFRNFIVHHYDNVVWGKMWETSQEKMKVVDYACKRLLEILEEEK